MEMSAKVNLLSYRGQRDCTVPVTARDTEAGRELAGSQPEGWGGGSVDKGTCCSVMRTGV